MARLFLLVLILCVCILSIGNAVAASDSYGEPASFRFASHYEDHMVLQRAPQLAVIWGFGQPGKPVMLMMGKQGNYTTTVGKGEGGVGIWKVLLRPQSPGGPFEITAKSVDASGKPSQIALADILFGDVWLCGGQSNMQFTVNMAFRGEEEAALAKNYPAIRLFTVNRVVSASPVREFPPASILQHWSVASNDTVAGPTWKYFSAVCWIYGRKLYDELKIPIGLVSSNYGGTYVQEWSSPDALAACNVTHSNDMSFARDWDSWFDYEGIPYNSRLWNAMITPLLNTTIAGAIWYQAEQNQYEPDLYACMFPAMVKDWRENFHDGSSGQTDVSFPFGFVQLCTQHNNATYLGTFPAMRWAQTANYGYVPNPKLPNTFMAVTIDLPDPTSPYTPIHPRDKTDVGQRVYLGAMATAYKKNVQWTGPIFDEALIMMVAPNFYGIVVSFRTNSVGTEGIEVRSEDGFEVLVGSGSNDAPSVWEPVKVVGQGNAFVVLLVFLDNGQTASSVRYEWRDYPCQFKACAVYAKDSQLPSPPFITHVVKRSQSQSDFEKIRDFL